LNLSNSLKLYSMSEKLQHASRRNSFDSQGKKENVDKNVLFESTILSTFSFSVTKRIFICNMLEFFGLSCTFSRICTCVIPIPRNILYNHFFRIFKSNTVHQCLPTFVPQPTATPLTFLANRTEFKCSLRKLAIYRHLIVLPLLSKNGQ
jgi:hypothetical protein